MKKITGFLALAAVGLVPVAAQAETLTLTVTADNAYGLYISTNNTTLGTLIGSNYGGDASQWSSSVTYSFNLTAPAYYLQVVGSNYTPENGKWPDQGSPNGGGGNPDGFIGTFSISGTAYSFANSSTTLNTDNVNWYGVPALNNTSWTTPTTLAQSYGANGIAPWGTIPGIPGNAEWIWSLPDNTLYADLSTLIVSTTGAPGATPLPGALPLFASGLGAFGLLRWRKKKKAAI